MEKTYTVSDLFYNNYSQLSTRKLAELAPVRRAWLDMIKKENIETHDDESLPQYGLLSIAVLRTLRKSPLLVDKINVEQAVDCLNDLTFLKDGWHFFPQFIRPTNAYHPEEYFHNRTFDHFIHADHEFSKGNAAGVAACLYFHDHGHFNPDKLAVNIRHIQQTWHEWQIQLVMHTYANVREWITKRCKNLFGPSPSAEGAQRADEVTGPMWTELKQRTAELRLTWKDPNGTETNYVGHARYLEVLDHLESISKRK